MFKSLYLQTNHKLNATLHIIHLKNELFRNIISSDLQLVIFMINDLNKKKCTRSQLIILSNTASNY